MRFRKLSIQWLPSHKDHMQLVISSLFFTQEVLSINKTYLDTNHTPFFHTQLFFKSEFLSLQVILSDPYNRQTQKLTCAQSEQLQGNFQLPYQGRNGFLDQEGCKESYLFIFWVTKSYF